jgi:hypothetical protein
MLIRSLFDIELLLKFVELFGEAGVGLAAGSCLLNLLEAAIEGPAVFLHHVGDEQNRASGDACCAVHQHVGLFSAFFDEVVGWLEGMPCVLSVAIVKIER